MIWPEDAVPCIWMEAGIVEYKLCDQNFECDTCDFYASMTSGGVHTPSHPSAALEEKDENAATINDLQGEKLPQPQPNPLPKTIVRENCYYADAFWYICPHGNDFVEIGLTRTGLKLLPPVNEVILTGSNSSVARGKSFCWMLFGVGTLSLPAPISGVIDAVNKSFADQLRHQNPDDLWLARMRVENLNAELQRCYKGDDAEKNLEIQYKMIMEKLVSFMPASPGARQTMQDGGGLVDNFQEIIGPAAYYDFLCQIFQPQSG